MRLPSLNRTSEVEDHGASRGERNTARQLRPPSTLLQTTPSRTGVAEPACAPETSHPRAASTNDRAVGTYPWKGVLRRNDAPPSRVRTMLAVPKAPHGEHEPLKTAAP